VPFLTPQKYCGGGCMQYEEEDTYSAWHDSSKVLDTVTFSTSLSTMSERHVCSEFEKQRGKKLPGTVLATTPMRANSLT